MSKATSSPLKTRIVGLLESLATNSAEYAGGRVEVATTCRSLANRILDLVSRQAEARKIVMKLANGSLTTVFSLVAPTQDPIAAATALDIALALCARPSWTGRIARSGLTDKTWQLLVHKCQSPDASKNDRAFHITCLQVLVRCSSYERSFATRARFCGGVPIVCTLIKSADGVMLDVCLRLVKALAKSDLNAKLMVKNGVVDHMAKLLSKMSASDMTLVKLCAEALIVLMKQGAVGGAKGQAEIVRVSMDIVKKLMSGMTHAKSAAKPATCGSILALMKTLTKHPAGQQALAKEGCFEFLVKLIQTSSHKPSMKAISTTATGILRSSLPRMPLPVRTLEHPVKYAVRQPEVVETATEGSTDKQPADESVVAAAVAAAAAAAGTRGAGALTTHATADCATAHSSEKAEDLQASQPFDDRTIGYGGLVASAGGLVFDVGVTDVPVKDQNMLTAVPEMAGFSQEYFMEFFAERHKLRNPHPVTLQPAASTAVNSSNAPFGNRLPPPSLYHVVPFSEGPFFDVHPAQSSWSCTVDEQMNKTPRRHYRKLVMEDAARVAEPSECLNRVVFDLDHLLAGSRSDPGCRRPLTTGFQLSPHEAGLRISQGFQKLRYSDAGHDGLRPLVFESRFECGNLRKATQIRDYEYDLILSPDINTDRHHQWFCFSVRHMQPGAKYRFNIVNCEKPHSQFETGMQPVMFSLKDYHAHYQKQKGAASTPDNDSLQDMTSEEATNTSAAFPPYVADSDFLMWKRVGTSISYYSNNILRTEDTKNPFLVKKTYFTASFTIEFPHDGDICYLAYHYPYTYTRMQRLVSMLEDCHGDNIVFKSQSLCTTLSGNECPLLTITAPYSSTNTSLPSEVKCKTSQLDPSDEDHSSSQSFAQGTEWSSTAGAEKNRDEEDKNLESREYVVLSSRVHPGETNSSWMMEGMLEFLTSNHSLAKLLRQRFVFKIVPMLNPDGVINGHHRVSLSGQDLNRCYIEPCKVVQPTVFHLKGLLQYLTEKNISPRLVCDFHGHSRRKNVFMFGCGVGNSSKDASRKLTEEEVFPSLLADIAPAFSFRACSFDVEKSKEATARVVGWQRLGVRACYTLESTYCGADQGQYKGLQFSPFHLKEMGEVFCQALLMLETRGNGPSHMTLDDLLRRANRPSTAIFRAEKGESSNDKGDDSEESPDEDGESLAATKAVKTKKKVTKKSKKAKKAEHPDSAGEKEEDEEDEDEDVDMACDMDDDGAEAAEALYDLADGDEDSESADDEHEHMT